MVKSRVSRIRQRCAAIIAMLLAAWISGSHTASSQEPVIIPPVDIDQKKLDENKYPLHKVIESGARFFSLPYTRYDPASQTGDGLGEGENGPRTTQRRAAYPEDGASYGFSKVNGLDSQSCFECHNAIGAHGAINPPGGLPRKPGSTGGSAGVSSNIVINPSFPQRAPHLVRNPLHVFGSGYVQAAALEMTIDQLLLQQLAARRAALKQPGVIKSITLEAKGISFGVFHTAYNAGSDAKVIGCDQFSSTPAATFGEKGFTDDYSEVKGVACDLVVRPFQWKGISSSLRHFIRDSLDFHFSIQAAEKYGEADCDKDGKRKEITAGNVSALVAFVALTRPPVQQITAGKEAVVRRGEQIFVGQAPGLKLINRMCASCHTPKLTLNVPTLVIENPGPANISDADCSSRNAGLVSPAPQLSLPAIRFLSRRLDNVLQAARVREILQSPDSSADAIYASLRDASRAATEKSPDPGYRINLSNPGLNVPNYALPRLKPNQDGVIEVPLLSDLKLHDMGVGLQDAGPQNADAQGVIIPRSFFLTRPLWGVGDTGPWLHDGRASTLREAILLHESAGSEANAVIEAFRRLPPDQQQALIEYLLSLRLPVEPGLTMQNNPER